MTQPLAGIQVVELATGVAGPYVGKLLADFGADVIKVEPPGGDPARFHGPFPDDKPDPEQSALFLHLNGNKRSVAADLDRAHDRALVAELAADAAILIESVAPGDLERRGLGVAALHEANPGLVVTSVTPFGQTGPYADRLGADIVTYAMGGPMFGTGVAEREPAKLGGNLTSYQCGNVAATATLAALTMAEQSGRGTHIDLSMFEAQAGSIDRRVTYLLWYLWTGQVVPRAEAATMRALPNGFFPTADGHVLAFTLPPWVPRMLAVLDDPDLAKRFAEPDWLADEELPDLVQAALYPWLFEGDKADRSRTAQAHKWPLTALNPPVDVLRDEHFDLRSFFTPAEQAHPEAGTFRQPGAPFRLGDAWRLRAPAPVLDQHGAEIRAAVRSTRGAPFGPVPAPATSANRPARTEQRLPLEGIRVLDMTVVWAGPACTMHLADLGAEVIRVDNPYVFPPATRGHLPRPDAAIVADFGPLGGGYPNLDVSGRPWNKHGMWSAHARNKKSCTLDIRTELGRETFLRLVGECDVFVENNSSPTMDKLGIGWDALHAANPRLIALRMPPMSLSGPYSEYVGFGASFEALCGLTMLRGYRDDDPTTTSAVFHMDPTSGATGAFAVLCALRRRAETGVGELVEFAQSEAMMQHIGEYFVDAERTGRRHGPYGNRHVTHAPQGCYRCIGDDRWLVLSVETDEQWAGLCTALGRPGLVDDARFATAADRQANHDELDGLIEAWTAGLDRHEAWERLQAAGVPSGPVLDEADAYADPHLADRGFFRTQGSDDVGTWDFPGHQWRWTGPPMRWESICALGDANEYVYRRLLGLTDAEYAALEAEGHLTPDYLQPDGTPY